MLVPVYLIWRTPKVRSTPAIAVARSWRTCSVWGPTLSPRSTSSGGGRELQRIRMARTITYRLAGGGARVVYVGGRMIVRAVRIPTSINSGSISPRVVLR